MHIRYIWTNDNTKKETEKHSVFNLSLLSFESSLTAFTKQCPKQLRLVLEKLEYKNNFICCYGFNLIINKC